MFLTFKSFVALTLSLGSHSRTHNSQDIILMLCVSNHDDTSLDWPNGDEPILLVGMFLIVDFQVLNATLEKLAGLVKGHAVLCPIALVLRWIPLKSHGIGTIYVIG